MSILKKFQSVGQNSARLVGSGLEIGSLVLAVNDFNDAFNKNLTHVQSQPERDVMKSMSRDLQRIIDKRNEFLKERDARQQMIHIYTAVAATSFVGIMFNKLVFYKLKKRFQLYCTFC